MVRSTTPTTSPFLQNGVSNAPLVILPISNGHISTTGHPIHCMFRSAAGFRGRQIEWRYFRLEQIQDGGQPPSWNIRMPISPERVIRFTSCLVLGYGFHCRRIKWRYFRFDQIQDGSRPPSWKITAASRGSLRQHGLLVAVLMSVTKQDRLLYCDKLQFFLLYLLFSKFPSNFIVSESGVTIHNQFWIWRLDTWRHRAMDHSTCHRPFPIRGLLESSLYLQLFSK